jgi:hypothetical protein
VNVVNINDHAKPAATVINNNKVTMYRPVFKQAAPVNQMKAAPKNVQQYKPRPKPTNP